jgi:small-conductance mechanosensitive channel
VEALLLQALQHPLVLLDPAPAVFLSDIKENSLDFDLYAYTNEPAQALRLGSDLRFRILELLREHGIELPATLKDVLGRAPAQPVDGTKGTGSPAGSQ